MTRVDGVGDTPRPLSPCDPDCPACAISGDEWEAMRANAGAQYVLLDDITCTCGEECDPAAGGEMR